MGNISGLKIAACNIRRSETRRFLARTGFSTLSREKAEERLKTSGAGIDDYVILSLWAVFERRALACLQQECEKLLDDNGSDFNKKLHNMIDEGLEYWRLNEILDLFKSFADSNLIGIAKQIKDYRDWIAHRNPRKLPPATVTPEQAFRSLVNIVEILDHHFGTDTVSENERDQ